MSRKRKRDAGGSLDPKRPRVDLPPDPADDVPMAPASEDEDDYSEELAELSQFEDEDEADDGYDERGPSNAPGVLHPAPSASGGRAEWFRREPPAVDTRGQSMAFQQLEMDYVVLRSRPFQEFRYSGPQRSEVAVMRFYGVTDGGDSLMLRVWGFMPYFYAQPPPNFDLSPDCVEKFKEYVCSLLSRNHPTTLKPNTRWIEHIEVVDRKSLWMHQRSGETKFLRIYTGLPMYVTRTRDLLTKGFHIPGIGTRRMTTFESNVLFVLRCCIDAEIVGCNWLEIPAGKYHLCPPGQKTSRSSYELDCSSDDLISHAAVGPWQRIAPARILSFDIECLGYSEPGPRRRGRGKKQKQKQKDKVHFPKATHPKCAVIQIANTLTYQGESAPRVKNVFVLQECSPISGCDIFSFQKEEELLLAWSQFVLDSDPDILTGYNIVNFDIPYLLDRAKHLRVERFRFLGRIINTKAQCRKSRFASKQMGARETREITIRGRVILDVLDVVRRDYKLSSYTLNNVSSVYLKQQKEDVHYSIIHELQAKDNETRKRLALYCLKDALLPQRLIDKLLIIYNKFEMARVCGISITMLLRRGQQIKVVSQLLREARKRGLIMPYIPVRGAADSARFVGATVLKPVSGFYQKYPISTLDFASLYPSIMIAHNLCYTTLISPRDVHLYKPEDVTKTPLGHFFVKKNVCQGLLPLVLRNLLDARAKAKADLKLEKDPLKKAVLNGRQLALKISANSVYGFTGAAQGQLPCLQISGSVTAFGRQMIDDTKKWVETEYSVKNGFRWDSQVIYGDTDSVMIKFGTQDLAEAMSLGKEAAKKVSTIFIDPIRLEFEKTYHPYLLLTKKRYAGLLYTKPDHYDYIDTKGIETVRRDTCALVRNVMKTCLYLILIRQSLSQAKAYVKRMMSCLLQNQLDIAMLIITKSLAMKEYKSRQAHSELAARLRLRDPATAPKQGDRVMFVYIQKGRDAKGYEKSEDPTYVLERNLPLDTGYYLKHKLQPSLRRLFEKILKPREMGDLLEGDHTRKIVIPTPASGGIMRFARKKITCLGCKRPVKGNVPVCSECLPDEAAVYEKVMNQRNHFEELSRKAWTYCQRCQESVHQEVLCSNDDCPIFYMRTQVRNELRTCQKTLERFSSIDW